MKWHNMGTIDRRQSYLEANPDAQDYELPTDRAQTFGRPYQTLSGKWGFEWEHRKHLDDIGDAPAEAWSNKEDLQEYISAHRNLDSVSSAKPAEKPAGKSPAEKPAGKSPTPTKPAEKKPAKKTKAATEAKVKETEERSAVKDKAKSDLESATKKTPPPAAVKGKGAKKKTAGKVTKEEEE